MKHVAIIVASGSGSRYHSTIPKQFTHINNKMVLEYTIEKFMNIVDEIIIMVHQDYQKSMVQYFSHLSNIQVCIGGKSRQESVLNGLKYLQKHTPDIVTIHDSVRPLVSQSMILDSLATAQKYNSAIPIIPIVDSLWQKNETHTLSTSCDRNLFVCSQTPQAFNYKQILQAHMHAKDILSQFSDCAGVYTNLFHNVHTYEGNKNNIKLTTTDDLAFIKFSLH
ncbi:MAG: 2-C-methyl-D-erythritol 4-phosphate cytidylyltransferase [Spirochaetota bacterium]|nr:2-C-methyl-D-erythritol 4-phosphate cytidylyltransferase [Spirochaetota bacterium]